MGQTAYGLLRGAGDWSIWTQGRRRRSRPTPPPPSAGRHISQLYRVFTKYWDKIVSAVIMHPIGLASSIQHEKNVSSFLSRNMLLFKACGASIGHSVDHCVSAAPRTLAAFSRDSNHLSIHLIPFLTYQLSIFSTSKTSAYTGVLNRP